MRAVIVFMDFVNRVIHGKRDVTEKFDAALARSARARKYADNVCDTVECGINDRKSSVDWKPSMEAVSRANADMGGAASFDLPLDVDGEPSPDPENARVRREVLGHDDLLDGASGG